MNFFKKRKLRKLAKQTLQHARHVRNMREDLLSSSDTTELDAKSGRLGETLRARDYILMEKALDELYACSEQLVPKRTFPGLRENLEIAVVAVTVAMAFRTYFIQPFKIPTGSMQPTLYGVQAEDRPRPGIADRLPLKLAKWLIFGEWYQEVRAKTSGLAGTDHSRANELDPASFYFRIGDKRHRVPKMVAPRLRLSSGTIAAGTLLWRGVRTVGDHVFVDKVRWNFVKPKRGDIVVFNTRGITRLEASLPKGGDGRPMTTHYIKRLVGLSGETLSIDPPDLVIDGKKVRTPETIGRIARREGEYKHGYQLVKRRREEDNPVLEHLSDRVILADDEYFAMGDNTTNSRDGRYWGTVPRENLVGPALVVYWPFSRRWGWAR